MTAMVLDSPLNRLQGNRGDQRAFARFGVRLTVTAWAVATPKSEQDENAADDLSIPREAPMRNMSVSGICFVSELSYPVGTVLGVTLDLEGTMVAVQAVVRRVVPQTESENTNYLCGAQFVRCEENNAAIPQIAQFLLKQSTQDIARAA